MESVKVRMLSEDDLGAIAEIDKKILGRYRPNYWKRKIALIDMYPRPYLVAELNGRVVGFVLANVSGWEYGVPSNIAFLDTIGVDPQYQRRGIAKALLSELISIFERTGSEATPEARSSEVLGVNTIYTMVKWYDLDLLAFFKSVGFEIGEMLNLELKL